MKIQERWMSALFLLVGAVVLSGCALFLVGAGVAVGAGTVAYVSGELRAADEVTMDRGWRATMAAMDDLQFKVTKTQKDALAGELIARRADDTRIVIRLKKQSDKVTEFRVRVGVFGDEDLSRLIYDKIKRHF
jgi:hypothetical protein